jgi:Plasmid recombination enzyme
MSLAICRIAKLKKSNLAGSGTHVSRTRPTLNANPSVTPLNRSLISSDDRSPLQDLVSAKIAETHQGAVRSNAVHAVEFLLSASPEYFRPNKPTDYGAYDPACLEAWVEHNIKWLKQEYGDKIVRAELHMDEATPHIHAYLVPIDGKGQLNCRGIFGERKNMFALQDSYAEAMEPLGIERGIRGSKARHTDVDKYYTAVNDFYGGGIDSVIANLQSENAQLIVKLHESVAEADGLRLERDDLRKQLEDKNREIKVLISKTKPVKQRQITLG